LPGTIVGHEYNKAIRILVALSEGNRFCQAVFKGESRNSGDAIVQSDVAKSRCPKRVARALRRRNSLHMAIQIWGRTRPRYRFGDRGPHSAQTEQSGETASLTSLWQLCQIDRPNAAQKEQSDETPLLISLSLRSQFHFVARPNVGRVYSRSHGAVIRVYDEAGNVIETHEHTGDSKEP
jgi:hypothetical protein